MPLHGPDDLQQRHLVAAPGRDSREASAVQAYDSFAGRAREMCGASPPVVLTAVDWEVPVARDNDIVIGWMVEGHRRIRIRISRQKAAKQCEALALLLGGLALVLDQPAATPDLNVELPNRKETRHLTQEDLADAWAVWSTGGSTMVDLAARHGVSPKAITLRFERIYGIKAVRMIGQAYRRFRFRPDRERAEQVVKAAALCGYRRALFKPKETIR